MTTSDHDRSTRLMMALAAHDGVRVTIAGLCAVSQSALMVSGAAIVLMGAQGLPGATYTSDSAFEPLEEVQFTTGVGPTLEAYQSGEAAMGNDLSSDAPVRWAAFNHAALRAGVHAVFSFPLQVGAARLGALTLYRRSRGVLDEDCFADAVVMARIVTRAILAMQSKAPEGVLAAELTEDEYAEVHQASGMVSAQLGIDIGEALSLIRARSFGQGASVRFIAGEVIARRLRLSS